MKTRGVSLPSRPWRQLSFALLLAAALGGGLPAGASIEREAIAVSQAALGRQVDGLAFIDHRGRTRTLDEFRGQPVLVSVIFTACVHSCQVQTRHLDRMVRVARNALGQNFTVLTIGFDQPVDTPQQMASYARRYGISDPDWHFLSSPDQETLDTLLETLGFLYQPSPRGFDHTVQVTLLDRDGSVLRQVYGEVFPTPQLVEPLKDLVFNRPISEAGLLGQLSDRVRLFCTVYDAQGDRYIFDYSLFAGIFIGFLVLASAIGWLVFEANGARLRRLV